jgi:hypothetical protein
MATMTRLAPTRGPVEHWQITDQEKLQAIEDMRACILAGGQTAQHSRISAGGERLYGQDDEAYVTLGTLPCSGVYDPPEELSQKIDGMTRVLPDADVRPGDRLIIGGDCYRVQSVRSRTWYGVLTHRRVELVLLHGS